MWLPPPPSPSMNSVWLCGDVFFARKPPKEYECSCIFAEKLIINSFFPLVSGKFIYITVFGRFLSKHKVIVSLYNNAMTCSLYQLSLRCSSDLYLTKPNLHMTYGNELLAEIIYLSD